MNLEETNLNVDAKTIGRLAAANGWSFYKEGGSHTLYRHPDTKEILAVPRHKGDLKPGTAKQLLRSIDYKVAHVKEAEEFNPPARPDKITLGKNKTKVKLNPEKLRELTVERIVKIIMETKADRIGQAYSIKDYNMAYSAPWVVLNDPDAPSSLKDLAYRVIQVRIEEGTEEDYQNLLNEKYTSEMSPKEYKTHVKRKANAAAWVAANPVHHDHVIEHFDKATSTEKEFGQNWYSDLHEHTKGLAHETGVSTNQMAGLIANYSPQSHWGDNMVTAAKVARTKVALGGISEKTDDEGKVRGIFASGKQKESAQKILDGADYNTVLKGNKIKAFGHLIEHGGDTDEAHPRVCVDRHAFSVACGKRVGKDEFEASGLKGNKRYHEVEQTYVTAAQKINERPENVAKGYSIKPHQLQAVTWLTRQRLNSDEENAGIKTASNTRTVKAGGGSKTAKVGVGAMNRYNKYMGEFHPKLIDHQPGTGYAVHENLWGMFADEEE